MIETIYYKQLNLQLRVHRDMTRRNEGTNTVLFDTM